MTSLAKALIRFVSFMEGIGTNSDEPSSFCQRRTLISNGRSFFGSILIKSML